MKRTIFILLLLTGFCIWNTEAQTVTQEQCQQADAQLNQVYQQLRGSLNDAQKQQLKQAQRDWIKKRDAFVAANPGNSQGALYQATMQRVAALQGVLQKVSGQTSGEGVTTPAHEETAPPTVQQYGINQQQIEIKREKSEAPNTVIQNIVTDVDCVDYSEELGLVVTGSISRKSIRIYDVHSRKFIREIKCAFPVKAIAFAKNKKVILVGNEVKSPLQIAVCSLNGETSELEKSKVDSVAKSGGVYNITSYTPFFSPSVGRLCFQYETKTGAGINDWRSELKASEFQFNNKQEKTFPLEALLYLGQDKSVSHYEKIVNEKLPPGVTKVLLPPNSAANNVVAIGESELFIIDYNNKKIDHVISGAIWPTYRICANSLGDTLALIAKNEVSLKIVNLNNFSVDNIEIPNCSRIFDAKWFNGELFVFYRSKNEESIYELANIKTAGKITINKLGGVAFQKAGDVSACIVNFNSADNKCMVKLTDKIQAVPEKRIWEKEQSYSISICSTSKDSTINSVNTAELPIDATADGRYVLYLTKSSVPGHHALLVDGNYMDISDDPVTGQTGGRIDEVNKLFAIYGDHRGTGNCAVFNFNGQKVQTFEDKEISNTPNGKRSFLGPVYDCYFFDKDHIIMVTPSELVCGDINTGAMSAVFQRNCSDFDYDTANAGSFNPSKNCYGACKAGSWNAIVQPDGQITLSLFDNKNSNSLNIACGRNSAFQIIQPNSEYLSRGGKIENLHFVIKNKAYPFEQFDLRLNRPDIVLERLGAPKEAIETAKSLREKRLKRMGVTEEMLKPDFHIPELQIVGDVPATTPKDQLDLQIKATDDKYPLDRLRVYVNNVPVNGRDGELLRDQKTQSLEKIIPIKLAAGRNKIQVSVLNSAGAESLYANAELNCTAERPKPKLYAVALGVSQYDRPEWCLKYAAKDATDLIEKLKAKSGSSYSEVRPLLLTDKEVTKESVAKIKEFLSGATIDDTVLIFMAGHGILDDKYDYYFGTTDIDPARPSDRGMPYEAIDNILAEVPSLKKALLMDTCHAGELDEDEKKELAATEGTATHSASPDASTNTATNSANESPLAGKVAMRAIGTRGMQVKAVEGAKGKSDWYEKLQDMFVDLRRGSGATVISSSQGAEYAFESSDQSNGLFTYALMEALDGKATPNKDGQITISSIGDYVKKRVQDLTKGKQNPNLRGVNLEEDFVLGTAK